MILVTGASGYIGSHLCYRLKELGKKFIGIDIDPHKNTIQGTKYYMIDMRDYSQLENIFKQFPIDCVIHLAGYKSIPESIEKPEEYFQNNINCTTNLLLAMKVSGCERIVFSSTCAVYGIMAESPVKEQDDLKFGNNAYAESKALCEHIIESSGAEPTILRYFNPIGEYYGLRDLSKGGVNYALREARKGKPLIINGGDYPTKDGTPERDFIDIKELVEAHIVALENNYFIGESVNIGTGAPTSVKELCISQCIQFEIGPKREGDTDSIWADTTLYKRLVEKK